MSECESLRVRINRNKEKIEIFKLNNKHKHKITLHHLEQENIILKRFLENKRKENHANS